MNAKEAREIIENHKNHTQRIRSVKYFPECFNPKCMEAKGYLEALEGPEVKVLVEALEDSIDALCGEFCSSQSEHQGHKKQDKALAQYREAIKK